MPSETSLWSVAMHMRAKQWCQSDSSNCRSWCSAWRARIWMEDWWLFWKYSAENRVASTYIRFSSVLAHIRRDPASLCLSTPQKSTFIYACPIAWMSPSVVIHFPVPIDRSNTPYIVCGIAGLEEVGCSKAAVWDERLRASSKQALEKPLLTLHQQNRPKYCWKLVRPVAV